MSELLGMTDLKTYSNLAASTKKIPEMNGLKGKKAEDLMKAAQEFESLFTNMVMQKMQDIVPDSEVFGNGKVKFFQSMLFEEYSKMSASTKGLGLAEQIYKQLSRAQAVLDGQQVEPEKSAAVIAAESAEVKK